jgi:hypothetical protein
MVLPSNGLLSSPLEDSSRFCRVEDRFAISRDDPADLLARANKGCKESLGSYLPLDYRLPNHLIDAEFFVYNAFYQFVAMDLLVA